MLHASSERYVVSSLFILFFKKCFRVWKLWMRADKTSMNKKRLYIYYLSSFSYSCSTKFTLLSRLMHHYFTVVLRALSISVRKTQSFLPPSFFLQSFWAASHVLCSFILHTSLFPEKIGSMGSPASLHIYALHTNRLRRPVTR